VAVSELETIFVVVPAGARIDGAVLQLTARVLVEFRWPSNIAEPSRRPDWTGRAVTVRLDSDDSSVGSASLSISILSPNLRLSAIGGGGSEPDSQATTEIVDVAPHVQRWARATASLIQQLGWPQSQPPLAVMRYLNAVTATRAANVRARTDDSILSSRFSSRFPDVAKILGLAWDVAFEINNWESLIDKDLWLQCIKNPSDTATITPVTHCVIRRTAGVVFWAPKLNQPNAFTEPSYEGVGRMIRRSANQPNWFIESSEYFSATIHDILSRRSSGLEVSSKPQADTGGLALACAGIGDVIRLIGPAPAMRNGNPVVGWRELFVGLRPDVMRDGDMWRSLVGTTVSYGSHVWESEGYVELSSVKAEPKALWQFEEVVRWDGSVVVRPLSQPDVGGMPLAVKARPDQAARLRWEHIYSIGVRPVFKGGWSLPVGDAAIIRRGWTPLLGQTAAARFRREEKVAAPRVYGLKLERDVYRINCSRDGGGVPSRVALDFRPPRASASLVKRSGELDDLSVAEQARRLRHASELYPDKSELEFPDPWADRLEVTVSLFGTGPSTQETELELNGQWYSIGRGQTYDIVVDWREKDRWPEFRPIQLVIQAKEFTRVRCDKQDIELQIAPGDRVTIELRCKLTADQATRQFAHGNRVAAVLANPSAQVLARLSRALVDHLALDARHVTRLPIEGPQFNEPTVLRLHGDREAVLQDLVRLDRQTTKEVVAELEWTDWERRPDGMKTVTKRMESVSQIMSTDSPSDFGVAGELTGFAHAALRLPFPDTRRRDVRVHLRAKARYGDLFGSAETVIGKQIRKLVPNSGRPSAPTVSLVLPAISNKSMMVQNSGLRTWQEEVGAQCLRVFVGPAWPETGDGEVLGVVCAPESQVDLPNKDRRASRSYFTQWGAEVLLATPPVPAGPFARHFPARSITFDGVFSATGNEGDQPRAAIIAGHQVKFDPGTKEYYADVVVDRDGSSHPWLRLAVVRLQPDSIPSAYVSPTVIVQFAQIRDERWVTISESPTDRTTLRIAASRTPARQGRELSRLGGVARFHRQLPRPETADPAIVMRIYDGIVWAESSVLELVPSSRPDGSYWLGEVRVQPREELLIIVEEYITFAQPNAPSALLSEIAVRLTS
jgi:hypothetical protein